MSSYYVIIESVKRGLNKKPLYSVLVKPSNINYNFQAHTMTGATLSIPKSEFKKWTPLANSRVYLFVGDVDFDVLSVKKDARLFFVGLSSAISESNTNDIYEFNVERIDKPVLNSHARTISEDIIYNQAGVNSRSFTQKIYNSINNYSYLNILTDIKYSDVLNTDISKNITLSIKKSDNIAKLVTRNNRRNQMFNMIDFNYNDENEIIFKVYFNNSIDNRQNESEPIPFTLLGENGYSDIESMAGLHGPPLFYTYQYSYTTRLGKSKTLNETSRIKIVSKKIYNLAGLEGWNLDESINTNITDYFTEIEIREFKTAFENASTKSQVQKYIDKIEFTLTLQAISRWYHDIMKYYQLKVVLANQNILIDKKHYNDNGIAKYPNQNEIWSVGTMLYIQDKNFFGHNEKIEWTVFSGTCYQENNNKFVELIVQPNLNISNIDFDNELFLINIRNTLNAINPNFTDKDVFEYLIDNIHNYPLQLKLMNPKNYSGTQLYSGQDYIEYGSY